MADQYAHHDLGFINPAIYRVGLSSSYHRAFHDVTTGSNGYPATPGWDPVTGWGAPNVQVLVPPARPLHQPLSRHRKTCHCEDQIIQYGWITKPRVYKAKPPR